MQRSNKIKIKIKTQTKTMTTITTTATTPISSPTANEWPQNQIHILDDHKSFIDSSSSSNKVIASMDVKSTNQNQQAAAAAAHDPHLQPLKCPRCDSSNTKFCYYNNYSLSQPRHFCKACKRYWTRGGTLRNVPVGGGCRKNKRVKRQSTSNGGDSVSSAASANPSVRPPQIDLSQASSHIGNKSPLFYGHLPTNPMELNFPFSSFRVSGSDNAAGFDQMSSGLGLGFSSGLMGTSEVQLNNNGYNKNGFKQIQDVSSSFPSAGSNSSSMFFGSSTSAMASLLATGLQHQKFVKDTDHHQAAAGNNDYQALMHDYGNHEVKLEGENRLQQWNPNPDQDPNQNPNHVEQINSSSSDPVSTSFLWNTSNVSAWFDPSNMGSSVPSLI